MATTVPASADREVPVGGAGAVRSRIAAWVVERDDGPMGGSMPAQLAEELVEVNLLVAERPPHWDTKVN